MDTKIFTIANQKGGVGKTTTAVNLSVGLARNGIPCLLVDLDPQGNASSAIGLSKKEGGSLFPCFIDKIPAENKVLTTAVDNLFLIPSEVDLATVEMELSQVDNYLGQLKRCLDPIRKSKQYGAIVLDCPPALGMLSMNALATADYLIIALQCEYLAMEGLGQILKVVDQLKDANINPNLTLGGILMTMFDMRTNLSRQVVNEVRTHFSEKVFETLIPRSIRLSEAPSFGQSIFDYDPHGAGALAYNNWVEEIKKRFLSP